MKDLFEIENAEVANNELCLIDKAYEVLHFHDVDILYTGLNKIGARIIGNVMCESSDDDEFKWALRKIHIVVTQKEYEDFRNRVIDYRSLIEKQKDVFVIDTDINDRLIQAHFCPLKSIPPEYLPIAGIVFCPNN